MLDDSNKIWDKTKKFLGFIAFLIPSDVLKEYLNIESTYLFKLILGLLVFIIFSILELRKRNKKIEEIEKKNNKLTKENKSLNKFHEKHIDLYNKYNQKEDSKTFKKIKKMLYEKELIDFMHDHSFASPFSIDLLDDMQNYVMEVEYDVEFKFLSDDLQFLKSKLDDNINNLYFLLSSHTFDLGSRVDFRIVPPEWETEQPERYKKTVDNANKYGRKAAINYNRLIDLARKRMLEI